jgi:hypothetical protein
VLTVGILSDGQHHVDLAASLMSIGRIHGLIEPLAILESCQHPEDRPTGSRL